MTGDHKKPTEDEAAFEQFIASSRRELERKARQAGIPTEDCADVVQETLVAASSQLKRGLFRRASSLGTWVYTILGGKILDYWKLAYNRHSSKAQQIDPDQELLPPLPAPQGAGMELGIAVREALAAIPPRERLLLILKYREEFTVPEIAAQLRWSERQVERVLSRARDLFRQNYLPEEHAGQHRLTEKGEQ